MKLLNRSFIVLTVAGLATMLVPVSAQAGGLAFDGKGNLFVLDAGSHSILKFTPDGKKRTFASGVSSHGVAFDRSGDLFVSENTKDAIFKFTSKGVKSTFASGLGYPTGLVFDGAGNLFVYDNIKNSIFKFTHDGTQSTFASGLRSVLCPICDGAGNLFVSDNTKNSILKFTPDGKESTFATGLSSDNMAFDGAGNLFVSNGDTIFKFDADGTKSIFASNRISPDKQWEYQCSDDGENASIVKAGATQAVLDLSEAVPSQWANNVGVVWAPDSKRFALNYKSGSRDHTTALYQLRADKWVALRSPEDAKEISSQLEGVILAQLKKEGLPKDTPQRSMWNDLTLRQWVDANTAILYEGSSRKAELENREAFLGAGFLFTLKFDAEGNWKIVKTHQTPE